VLKIVLNIFATILALSGYLLTYILNKEKLHRYRFLLVLVAVIAPALIWGEYVYQARESESLKAHLNEISKSNKELTTLLEPFTMKARISYPGFDDQAALQKLAYDISKMQPKLVFWGQTEPRRDPVTNLLHMDYGFRSQYPVGLRDIQIKIRFDGRFVAVNPAIRGALVREQGTRIVVDTDSSGFLYTTGYLSADNDIIIKIISRKQLTVTSMDLSP